MIPAVRITSAVLALACVAPLSTGVGAADTCNCLKYWQVAKHDDTSSADKRNFYSDKGQEGKKAGEEDILLDNGASCDGEGSWTEDNGAGEASTVVPSDAMADAKAAAAAAAKAYTDVGCDTDAAKDGCAELKQAKDAADMAVAVAGGDTFGPGNGGLENATEPAAPERKRRRHENDENECKKAYSGTSFDFEHGYMACAKYCAKCQCLGYAHEKDEKCFPADAQIEFQNGTFAPIAQLQVGDSIRVGPSQFEPVFMFSHEDHAANSEFVQLSISGQKSLTLSPGHYVYINGSLAAARTVKPFDVVVTVDGPAAVTAIARVARAGLFNPHTASGDIFVNGVKTSVYTETVAPSVAHALLWPAAKLASLGATIPGLGWLGGGERLAALAKTLGLDGKAVY